MLRLLARLASATGLIILYRWLLRMGTPRNDWWHVVEAAHRLNGGIRKAARMARMWLLWQMGVVPESVQAAWRTIRARYQAGAFGEAGT